MADPEKVPDSPRRQIDYCGIKLESRYGKRAELETMMSAVDVVADLWPYHLRAVTSVFCDSKCTAAYQISCRARYEEGVAALFDRAFIQVDGGYNEIMVESSQRQAHRDPYWIDDEFLPRGSDDGR